MTNNVILNDAARDVLAERRRQVDVEGWTTTCDDEHAQGQMARAAACYAAINSKPVPSMWPWAPEWWKPGDVRRNLVKAGALILAEIERLDRAAKGEQPIHTRDAAAPTVALDEEQAARALNWFNIARRHVFVQPEDEALIAKLSGVPARRGVNWTSVSEPPDVDTTVMLALADGEVWQGYFDGGVWIEVSGLPLAPGRVTYWKHTPSHPEDRA